MADYTSVLSRAIAGKNSYEERRVIYDRARNALVTQLRALDPPLPEADITRQRLALEESIRKVEATVAPPEPATAEPQAAAPPPPAAPPVPPPIPEPVAAAPVAPPVAPAAAPAPAVPRTSPLADAVREAESLGRAPAAAGQRMRETLPTAGPGYTPPAPEPAETAGERTLARVRSLPATEPDVQKPNRRPLIFAGLAAVLIAAVVAAGVAFWPSGSGAPTPVASNGSPQAPKVTDRVPADGTAPARPTPGQTVGPAPAGNSTTQNAFLIEENADNPRGSDSFRGTVAWRIDTEAGPQGPERIIRGLVEVQERGLKVLVTIRRNQDQTLPASHTVELLFDTPPDFVHGSVENVAGLRMKPSEQANGLPLVGASARITAGYFLIGLSALGPDRERNLVLLRDRPWIDLPLLYRNGRRAVLAIEKGPIGERVFQDAFQTWGG